MLRTLAAQVGTHDLVATTETTWDQLTVRLDADRYPDDVSAAGLDVRWYLNGDYAVHYVERWSEGDPSIWCCRWGCHPNPHNERVHVHTPPAAGDPVVDDPEAPTHPTDVLFRTLDWIEGRIGDLWA